MIDPIVKSLPEFMVRVKLPLAPKYFPFYSNGVEAYRVACRDAIFAVKPDGFEVSWPKDRQTWPEDSEGYTYVPLYCIDQHVWQQDLLYSVTALRARLKRIEEAVKS